MTVNWRVVLEIAGLIVLVAGLALISTALGMIAAGGAGVLLAQIPRGEG